MATVTEIERKIAAVDTRIDAVRAELIRVRGSFDELSVGDWHRAWNSYPGLQGIERSLFVRRGDLQRIRDAAAEREWRIEQRREARAFQKQTNARLDASRCPACGQVDFAAA